CPSTLGRCWDAPGTSQERPRPGTVGASQLGHPLFVTERHEPRSVPGHRRVRFLRPRGPGLRVDIRVFSVSPSRGASETWRPPAVGRSGTSTPGYGAPATV